jgi:hypothetical protein
MKKFLLKNYAPVFAVAFIYNTFLLTGCLANAYLPNNHNVPLLEKKGELKASATVNLTSSTPFFTISSITPSVQVNLAMAPIDNLGLIFNGGYSSRGLGSDDDFRNTKYHSDYYKINQGFNWELGCGIMKQPSKNLFLEIYALGGSGATTSIYSFYQFTSGGGSSSRTTQPIRVDYSTFSLQPVIGHRDGRLETALSLKATGINFRVARDQRNVDIKDLEALIVDFETYQSKFFLNPRIESAFTLRYGWENFKIQGQAGVGLFIINPLASSLWGSLGVQLNLSTFKEKDKTKS